MNDELPPFIYECPECRENDFEAIEDDMLRCRNCGKEISDGEPTQPMNTRKMSDMLKDDKSDE